MKVQFTAIHLEGGAGHESIANLKAKDPATNATYQDTKANWVTFIERGNIGFVHDNYGNTVSVLVRTNGVTKWLQTVADGKWTDNLLALPKY